MQDNIQNEHLSKKERAELKREQRLNEEEAREGKRRTWRYAKTAILVVVIGGVIGFISWWGYNMGNRREALANGSQTGAMAPGFTLPSSLGGQITLSDYKDKQNVLLYFHEGLSCQPCWEQLPELEKYKDDYEKLNVVLLSVALDPVEKWKATIEQYKITTPILSYESAQVENDYNLLPYSMGMGRRAGHTFVLVGMDGTIKWRKDYWPSRGHMVPGGTMYVSGQEILQALKANLPQS